MSHKGSAFNSDDVIDSMEQIIFSQNVDKIVVESTDRISRNPASAWKLYKRLHDANRTLVVEILSTNETVDFVAQFQTKILPDIVRGFESSAEKSKKLKRLHAEGLIKKRDPKPEDVNIQYFQRCAAWGCLRNEKIVSAKETWDILNQTFGLKISLYQIIKWRKLYPRLDEHDFYKFCCPISGFMIPISPDTTTEEIDYTLYKDYGLTEEVMKSISSGENAWKQNLIHETEAEDDIVEEEEFPRAEPPDYPAPPLPEGGNNDEWERVDSVTSSMETMNITSFQEDFTRLNILLEGNHITREEYVNLIRSKSNALDKSANN